LLRVCSRCWLSDPPMIFGTRPFSPFLRCGAHHGADGVGHPHAASSAHTGRPARRRVGGMADERSAPDVSKPDAIEPDTKDWTWVVHTPCPDCGFQPDAMTGADVPGLVRGYRDRWVKVLTRPDVAERPSPRVWSPLEYACHVRDVFGVFAGRVRLMLDQDEPTFADWDQDAAALDSDYGAQ